MENQLVGINCGILPNISKKFLFDHIDVAAQSAP